MTAGRVSVVAHVAIVLVIAVSIFDQTSTNVDIIILQS